MTIPINPISDNRFTNINYHVALLRDLTISFERALKEGTKSSTGAEGPLIIKEIESYSGINKLVVEVSPGAKGRYFVGICASGLDDAGIRIF